MIARARERLANHEYSYELAHFPLGASLGQCCGGSVAVLLEAQSGGDARLVVFGAGHVSHALMRIVGDLPWQITWVDSRQECFPDRTPDNTTVHCTDDPVGDVPELCSNAHVLILTHNHALDYDLCQALLKRDDVRTIGLIGSPSGAVTSRVSGPWKSRCPFPPSFLAWSLPTRPRNHQNEASPGGLSKRLRKKLNLTRLKSRARKRNPADNLTSLPTPGRRPFERWPGKHPVIKSSICSQFFLTSNTYLYEVIGHNVYNEEL